MEGEIRLNGKIFEQLVINLKERSEDLDVYIPSVFILPQDSEKNRFIKRFKSWVIVYLKIAEKSESQIINDLVLGIIASNRIPQSAKIDLQLKLVRECSNILRGLRVGAVVKADNKLTGDTYNGNAA